MQAYYYFYRPATTTLLSAGLKYHDTAVKASNNKAGNTWLIPLPAAIREKTAPDIAKKKPAYAHSFSKGNLGTNTLITPRIFQIPSKVRK